MLKALKKVPVVYANELMNVQQVAEYLSLSVQTIYGLVHKKEIPNSKRGKRLLNEVYLLLKNLKRN